MTTATTTTSSSSSKAALGIGLVLSAQVLQAAQTVAEERLLSPDRDKGQRGSAPPTLPVSRSAATATDTTTANGTNSNDYEQSSIAKARARASPLPSCSPWENR